MAKARGRVQRRHVREKATIDHLVRDVYEPKVPDEKDTSRSPLLLPACRSRIRFARNGILARVGFPLFVARDDEPLATSQATAGSRCGDEHPGC